MKISDMIKELQYIQDEHGDLPVELQDRELVHDELIYLVPEVRLCSEQKDTYTKTDKETVLIIRSWPY